MPGAIAASTPSATLGAIPAYTTPSATPFSSLLRLPWRSVPRLQKQLETCLESNTARDLSVVALPQRHGARDHVWHLHGAAKAAYNGIKIRFEDNVDLVATHMKLLECYTFEIVYGLTSFMSMLVTGKILIMNHVECSASESRALGSAVYSCALHVLLGFEPEVCQLDGRPYDPHAVQARGYT
ncbi:hypothetical protein GN958_ATG22593 [Phytophthora infestans]|uniref:Uncharacterized protein n=1 Tax=Phytophthora infestans TaxID=4787 RepID=A0A8S9THE5_PHYIN|nr:hypothetical protein GN958_ATG22593 [Phytophthora infestans]